MNANNPTNIKNNPIAKALKLPRGAEFHRCALRVNPSTYGHKFRGQRGSTNSETHARVIVEQAAEIGVSVLATTNQKT